MDKIKFAKFFKEERSKKFIKPYEQAYKSFITLGLDKLPESYFLENASLIIEQLREESWKVYVGAESGFSKSIYKSLNRKEIYQDLSPSEAIDKFIDNNADNFYDLSLSNTQSRRCRTGSEFESLIELLLMGAGIMLDSQGYLSSGIFAEHNLGKSVDLVSPGVLEYEIKKRSCSLISCKTTLRERWQEVNEEKQRTGASEIFLTTLDEKISSETIRIMNDCNIIPVVTEELKTSKYSNFNNVITFEEMLEIIKFKNNSWKKSDYSEDKLSERIELIDKQIERHNMSDHSYVVQFYCRIKSMLL